MRIVKRNERAIVNCCLPLLVVVAVVVRIGFSLMYQDDAVEEMFDDDGVAR